MRRRAISEPRAAGEAAPYVSGRPHQERPMRGIRADTRAGETESLSRRIAEPASPTPGGPPGAPCILRCGGTKARGWLFRVTVNAAYRRSSPSPTPLPDDREIDGEWDQWRNSPNPRSAPLPHTPTPHPPAPKIRQGIRRPNLPSGPNPPTIDRLPNGERRSAEDGIDGRFGAYALNFRAGPNILHRRRPSLEPESHL